MKRLDFSTWPGLLATASSFGEDGGGDHGGSSSARSAGADLHLRGARGGMAGVNAARPPPDRSLPPPLQFAVGIQSEREVSRAKVELEVTVESEGEETVVYRETFRSFQLNRWYPRRVDLNPWSEKPARIRLEVRPAFGISNPPWADRIRVAWGEPVVTRRERGGGPGAEIDSASV